MDPPPPQGPQQQQHPLRPSSSPSSDSPTQATTPIPDEDHGAGDLPLNMSASVVLTELPADAHAALERVEAGDERKVTVRFHPIGSAPPLRTKVFKISASQKFETVVNFLRKRLDCKPTDSVCLYVNSVFAPGLDEGVGNLWRCFRQGGEGETREGGQLVVGYSMTPAFG